MVDAKAKSKLRDARGWIAWGVAWGAVPGISWVANTLPRHRGESSDELAWVLTPFGGMWVLAGLMTFVVASVFELVAIRMTAVPRMLLCLASALVSVFITTRIGTLVFR